MRIARFQMSGGKIGYGVVRGETIHPICGGVFGKWEETGEGLPLGGVRLLAPVVPVNIVAIGRNYREHAKENNADVPQAPIVFLKPTSALNDPGAPILLPRMAPSQVDYEAELAVVIGKTAKRVPEKKALEYVLGYACGHDVSARDCQFADAQWARGKSFDTFAPMGPWIETELDPTSCDVVGRLNGQIMQQSNTRELIFPVAALVSYLSECMTLQPGTVILTGTPAGCGFARQPPVWLKEGDVFEVEIGGIGTLRNPVALER